MRPTALVICASPAALELVWAMLVSCSKVENCAIWASHCVLSVGCIGSWWLTWAIISFRNMSLSTALVAVRAAAFDVAVGFVVDVAGGVTGLYVMSVIASSSQARTSTSAPAGSPTAVAAVV